LVEVVAAEDTGAEEPDAAGVDDAGAEDADAGAEEEAGVAAADVAALDAEVEVEVLAAGVLELLLVLLEQPVATRLTAAAATRRAVGRRLTIARMCSPSKCSRRPDGKRVEQVAADRAV
jgi:hypothetical protein